MYPEISSRNKIVIAAVVLIVILSGAYLALRLKTSNTSISTSEIVNKSRPTGTAAPEVEVTLANENGSGTKQVPPGFPNLPVEGEIVESYKALYSTKNITQYTLSYFSVKTKADLLSEYKTFLSANGYKIEETSDTIHATKNTDTLSIIISNPQSKSFVQLNYLDRP
jgi:hypothetical protein